MHMLHLPTRITSLVSEIETDQRECNTNRAHVSPNVLGTIGVNRQLMNKLDVSVRQGVGGHFAVELPTRSRRIVTPFWLGLRHGEADATAWTVLIKRRDHNKA